MNPHTKVSPIHFFNEHGVSELTEAFLLGRIEELETERDLLVAKCDRFKERIKELQTAE